MNGLELLVLLGKVPPEAWDYIHPKHDLAWRGAARSQATPADAYVVAAAQLAQELTRATLVAGAKDKAASTFLMAIVDEWCGTPWPRKWPRPRPWPWPWPPEPDPEPWWEDALARGRMVGATVFATTADALDDRALRTVFNDAAQRLFEVAVPGVSVEGNVVTKAKRAVRR